jgi:hypothetical protein
MKIALSLLAVLLLGMPQSPPPQQKLTSFLPIDTNVVKKAIVFLYYPKRGNDFELGTGFFVGIPTTADPNRNIFVIVTARHIVDPEWSGCSWKNPTSITVRVNDQDYKPGISSTGVRELDFPLLANGRRMWWAPEDDRVDVAVIPLATENELGLLNKEAQGIALSTFATPEEIDKFAIGIGANILSAGLVPNFWNTKRNYPAFKFGKVSNVFDEPVKMHCNVGDPEKDRLSWLIAGNFVPGNSGSPILLMPLEIGLGSGFSYNGPRNMLLGVLSGSLEGADLAEMAPIEYVFEIIQKNIPNVDLYRGDPKNRPGLATEK